MKLMVSAAAEFFVSKADDRLSANVWSSLVSRFVGDVQPLPVNLAEIESS